MNTSSLPTYPNLRGPRPGDAKTSPMISARAQRVLLDLALLAAITAMLLGLRRLDTLVERPAEPSSRPRLDFTVVQERFGQLRLSASRVEVEELLGPPAPEFAWEPEFQRWAELAEHNNRHWSPRGSRVWVKWIDPQDEKRWVAVLFATEIVLSIHKKGF